MLFYLSHNTETILSYLYSLKPNEKYKMNKCNIFAEYEWACTCVDFAEVEKYDMAH